jgi:FlaA1/EpsC-like NDP-sugar epimerase
MAYSQDFQITTARFANVAFSNGSLLDGYLQRIIKNQPISCPSDINRFFVSPEESGQICMLACLLGSSGDIFFPKFASDEMVNFKEITLDFFKAMSRKIQMCSSEEEAKRMTFMLTKTSPYPVYFFDSNTSGEKLYEEFYTDEDVLDLSSHSSLGVIKNAKRISIPQVELCLNEIKSILSNETYSKEVIVRVLKYYLPDFRHIETGKSLDTRM